MDNISGVAPVKVPPLIPLPMKPSGMGMGAEAKRIDAVFQVKLPLSFDRFNVMCWAYYLTKSYCSSGLPSRM